jgi:hypothetical protein
MPKQKSKKTNDLTFKADWTNEWRYAEDRILRRAMRRRTRIALSILLNEEILDRFPVCAMANIHNCPLRVSTNKPAYIGRCLAPKSHLETATYARDCFLLRYLQKGNKIMIRVQAWIRSYKLDKGKSMT